MQNDLGGLGLAMRDMLDGDESYPLYAWSAQFDRIRKDLDDAIHLESLLRFPIHISGPGEFDPRSRFQARRGPVLDFSRSHVRPRS